MVTEWIKEVAVGPALCVSTLWISTVHKHNVPTANCVTAVSELLCAHTEHRHMCLFTMGNPRRKHGSPSLPALSQHWDHQGHGTTDNHWHYPCSCSVCRIAAGCTGWPALPMESVGQTSDSSKTKHRVFVSDESNYFQFSLKRASSKIYAKKVSSC